MRVAIIGRTQILWNSLKLLENKHEVVLIGTSKSAPEYAVTEEWFEQEAQRLGIPFFNTTKINSDEIVSLLIRVKADIAISINWVNLIGQEVINCFPNGILNAHIGDLPRYRGNACPNWAILNGEKRIGISIHYMVSNELDAGDIVEKEYYPIEKDTDITQIYEAAKRIIPQLFISAIDKIEKHKNIGIRQSENAQDILRCYPRIPTDSFIDWNESCENISRIVRASCSPFDGAYTFFGEYKIKVLCCSVRGFPTQVLAIPGQVIMIDRISDKIDVIAKDGIVRIEKAEVMGGLKKLTEIVTSVRGRMNYSVQDKLFELEQRIKELEGKKNDL